MMAIKNLQKKNAAGFEGELDENDMRTGHGEEIHRRKHGNEYYNGSFTKDAYNGLGCYKNDSIFEPKWTYEGSFFSNTKEGYGLLSLPDNTYFEGLYESDRPFGPGVLTRMNGDQDVGFWLSSSIIRLIREVPCEIQEFSIAPENIAYMARFKKLVEIAPPKSIALKVTGSLSMPDEVAPQLYSVYCKDPKSFLFNYEAFEQLHFNDLKKMGDLIPMLSMEDFSESSLEEVEETAEDKTVQEETVNNEMFERYGEFTFNENTDTGENVGRTYTVDETPSQWDRLRKRVNLLLAWNNSPLIVDMMTHTFVNRIYEKMVGFDVANVLCYRRHKFEPSGPLEWASVELLKSSNTGDVRDFTWFLFSNNLNINVQDSRGNGCVIRAGAGDHHALLYLVFLYGANMNSTNDEGFTALNHTLTRYLALIHNVKNWGTAFLPLASATNEVKARIWRKCSDTSAETKKSSSKSTKSTKTKKSFKLQSRKSTKSGKSKVATPVNKAPVPRSSGDEGTRYIFDLNPAKKAAHHQKLSTGKRPMKNISIPEVKDSFEETDRKNRITEVCKTLALLISLKINPNESNVPQPAIILALFSGDVELVKMLLEAGADPNARMLPEQGWLTPLHILCLAKPQPSFPEIMDLLLEHDADPNARAAIDFSQENREFVLHGHREEEFIVAGVTPLQALLLRSDSTFVEGKEILKELLLRLHDITSKETNYIGHTFLSLAMIRTNLAFIFALLHIFSEDPNEELDVHWGNIATAYLIYLGRLKEPEAIITLIELEQAGMNPLRIVDTLKDSEDEENSINFGLRLMKVTTATGNGKSIIDHKDGKQSVGSPNVEKKKSGTTMSYASAGSRKSGSSQGKTHKVQRELLKKVTLLQDLGRDKVDKYVRGVVLRRLLKYLREKDYQGQKVEMADNPIKQALNWFATDEEFVQVLMHNVLAGHTFVSKEDVKTVYNIMPWENLKSPPAAVPMKKMTTQRDSLSQRDKVLLRQLKEAIRNHLKSGTAPENISFAKKKAPSGSKKSRTKSPSAHAKGKQDDGSVSLVLNHDDHEQFEGQFTTIEERTHEQNLAAFLEKVDVLLVMCAPQVRWAKRYGAKSLRLPKRQTYRTDFYPEVDKNPFLYHVCYKCVKRDPALQLCPVCRLIWYCSSRCSIRDVMNPNSNHRCKADFYGRGDMWRQYDFDEEGNILRIPRNTKGHVDWEADDMLNDALLKKHGKKTLSPDRAMTPGSGRYGNRGTSVKDGQGQGLRHDARDSKGRWIGSGERGRGERGRGSHRSKSGRREGGGGRDSYDAHGNLKHHTGPGGKHSGEARGKYQVGPDGKYRVGPDGKLIERAGGAKGDKKARLREKRELKMREARRLRELRNKMPKGVMGDFMKWGLMMMQDLQEKPWYQKQQAEGPLGSLGVPPGEMGSSDAYNRLKSQLHILEDLARILGSRMDLHNLFPWVVLRDGELYYKFSSTLFVMENYSFN